MKIAKDMCCKRKFVLSLELFFNNRVKAKWKKSKGLLIENINFVITLHNNWKRIFLHTLLPEMEDIHKIVFFFFFQRIKSLLLFFRALSLEVSGRTCPRNHTQRILQGEFISIRTTCNYSDRSAVLSLSSSLVIQNHTIARPFLTKFNCIHQNLTIICSFAK